MIKAAIFDMDGLLIDSEPFWRDSHIAALAKHGITITHDDVRPMAGKRTDEVIRHWREAYAIEHIPNERLEKEVIASVIQSIQLNGRELPGVRHVINLFRERGVPMAVASSSPPDIIKAVLDKLHLIEYFKVTYSAKHEQFGKPRLGVFLTTAKKLDVKPGDCIVFEDALSGVKAAKAAGMKCVAVPDSANMDKSLMSYKSNYSY